MNPYLRRSATAADDGRTLTVGLPRQKDGLRHIGLEAFTLAAEQDIARADEGVETVLVLLSGIGRIRAGALDAEIGGRRNPFDGPGYSVYLPASIAWAFTAQSSCELALCHAAAGAGGAARVIAPRDVRLSERGTGIYRREIRDVLSETEPAEAILVVEVITPGGHWSSFPPHRHDRHALPQETLLEEIYYHRFRDPAGFGFQRIYGDGLDEALPLTDGVAVLVPRGYHPVAAAPGYDLYYLNVMAGPVRAWRAATDPAHAWLSV
jgi:5-deoxy-glucuronate isomerase